MRRPTPSSTTMSLRSSKGAVTRSSTCPSSTCRAQYEGVEPAMSTVDIEQVEPHISVIRLNRPERRNAMSFELVGDLHDALDAVAADAQCKVVVLTGAGKGFCAGLDLKDWGAVPEPGAHRSMRVGMDGQAFIS